jgi:hypothetical protein
MKTTVITMLAMSFVLTSCVKVKNENGEKGKDGWEFSRE